MENYWSRNRANTDLYVGLLIFRICLQFRSTDNLYITEIVSEQTKHFDKDCAGNWYHTKWKRSECNVEEMPCLRVSIIAHTRFMYTWQILSPGKVSSALLSLSLFHAVTLRSVMFPTPSSSACPSPPIPYPSLSLYLVTLEDSVSLRRGVTSCSRIWPRISRNSTHESLKPSPMRETI